MSSIAERGGIWSALEAAAAAPAHLDLWQALDRQLDLGRYVPRPSPGIEVHRLTSNSGRIYYVLRSPEPRYLRLESDDYALWELVNGARSVQEIALAHFLRRGDFAADRLARLIHELRAAGFLGPPPVDVFAALSRRRGRRPLRGTVLQTISKLLVFDVVRVAEADRLIGRFYRRVGWLLYTRPSRLLWAATIGLGVAVWAYQFSRADHSLLKTNGSYLLGLLTIAVLDVLGITLHDIAQALTLKRHGRRINGAGLMLYYFMPTIFLETSDVWLARRGQRVAVTWSGPCAMLVLGSALAIVALPLDGTELGAFLFKGATIWLANALFNLLPILDLDGYYILVDWLEMPALRQNSVRFLQSSLLDKLRGRERLTREELILATFGIGSGLLVLLIPLVVYWARDLRYADSLLDLWNSPEPMAEAMAVAMFAMFLGPAAVAIASQPAKGALALARFGSRTVRKRRGRVPLEYINALADLPFLRDAARAEVLAIARHLEPRTAMAGTVLVRQGARGDRFYLLQEGRVRVEKLTADGRMVLLARMGPGDYFGETALLARVPRTATVTAETDTRLLALDAGHFRRWLAGRVDVANALRRSLAERERLAALPLLRGTGPAELDRLVACLLVTRYSPGDVIVRQGEPGDRFFLLSEGRVEVVRDDGAGPRRVAELEAGDFFGEMSLLYDEPRSATVRALTAVETYTLNAADFHALLGRLSTSGTLRRVADDRRRKNWR